MTTASERAFLEHDWRNDAKWQEYLTQLYPTPSANKVMKYKKKYYKKEIDPEFDLNCNLEGGEDGSGASTTASSSTQQHYGMPPPPPQAAAAQYGGNRPSLEKVATLHLVAGLIFGVISLLPVSLAPRAYTVSLMAFIIGCLANVCSCLGVPKFNVMWWSTACQLEAFQVLMIVMGASSMKMYAGMLSPAIGAVQMVADSPSLNQVSMLKPYFNMVKLRRVELNQLRAHLEVATGVLIIVFCMMGRTRLWPVILYWQTLRGRASLNYHVRQSFGICHGYVLRLLRHPLAPGALLRGYEWIVSKVAQ